MRSYKVITCFLTILLMGLQACQKNALDVAPLDQLSTASFWKSEKDVQAALAACYAFFKRNGASNWEHSQQFPTAWDAFSDDCYDQYNPSGIATISINGPTPTTGGFLLDAYTVAYQSIAGFNYFLANVDKVTMDETSRKKYTGEVYFLRAFIYFQLAHLYGNVIITKEPANDTYKEARPKSTRDEVLAFVNEDLDKAITTLPDAAYTDGHVMKGTAQSLKARVLLYQKKYTEAAAMAKAVIDGGKFKLGPDYSQLFYKPGQTNNPEIMFSVINLPPNSNPQYGVDLFIGSWLGYQPTADLVNEYESKDGLPTSSSPLYKSATPYENRDPRLRMTIFVPGDDASKGWLKYNYSQDVFKPFTGGSTTGFAMKKMLDPTRSDPQYATISDQDYVLMRYAEVLLNYAEAENEAAGPANAYAAINQVRARVGMPALPAGLTQATMRDRIRHERRIELALEGFRYYDLRRWGTAAQKLNGFEIVPGNTNLKKKIYESRFDLWPLPQTEIDRTPGLIQNPGY